MKPKDRSRIEYSRDELSGPLRHLEEVILRIQEGKFEPDNTRSGRFPDPADKRREAKITESDSESSSSSSDSGRPGDESRLKQRASTMLAKKIRQGDGNFPTWPSTGVWQHKETAYLHIGDGSRKTLFLCSRARSGNYVERQDWPQLPSPKCPTCFKRVQLCNSSTSSFSSSSSTSKVSSDKDC